jgi:hypothetical protein
LKKGALMYVYAAHRTVAHSVGPQYTMQLTTKGFEHIVHSAHNAPRTSHHSIHAAPDIQHTANSTH